MSANHREGAAMGVTIGWDIGGAHLKLALLREGRLAAIRQLPCPLWQGLDRLEAAMKAGLADWPEAPHHAVTMTGELVDLFPDRASGVRALIDTLVQRLGESAIAVYAADGAFLTTAEARAEPDRAASANWHASARLAAHLTGDGLLVDIGSTTTDLVPFRKGAVAALAVDDAGRLVTGELVYRGAVRTPVMAVIRHAEFEGVRTGVMAEHFATMADIFRLTGDLPAHADQHGTADGKGKSLAESRVRLARMIGRDAASAGHESWADLARFIAARQLDQLAEAAQSLLSRSGFPADAPLIGAGVGRFLLPGLARRLDRPYHDFAGLIESKEAELAADCLPSYAVAVLFSNNSQSVSPGLDIDGASFETALDGASSG